MERHQHAVVQILPHLGQVWVYASHKPELLTTSMMVFGRERPTFGDETISIASYCFQIFSHVNIEQQELCEFFYFFKMPLLAVIIRVRHLSKWTQKIPHHVGRHSMIACQVP